MSECGICGKRPTGNPCDHIIYNEYAALLAALAAAKSEAESYRKMWIDAQTACKKHALRGDDLEASLKSASSDRDRLRRALVGLANKAQEADCYCWGPAYDGPERAAVVAKELRFALIQAKEALGGTVNLKEQADELNDKLRELRTIRGAKIQDAVGLIESALRDVAKRCAEIARDKMCSDHVAEAIKTEFQIP